jgi:dynein heavy chain
MLSSEQGRTVTRKYLVVAKSMREYEEQLYFQWCNAVETSSLQHLKAHILTIETNLLQHSEDSHFDKDPNDPFPLHEKIKVNFKAELQEIIKEAKYLDKMGFTVPESALNVALQVRNCLFFVFSFFLKKNFVLGRKILYIGRKFECYVT